MAFQARDANEILQSEGPGGLRSAFDNATRDTPDDVDVSAPEKARPKDGANRTQAQLLIDIAGGDGVELYRAPDGTTYADIHVNGHRETWPLKSKGFQRWLRLVFYQRTGGAPNGEAMSTAMGVIEARAQFFDGMSHPVYLRVAAHGGLIYIDIGDESWAAIEIDGEGWRIVRTPPARANTGYASPAHPTSWRRYQ